MNACAAVHRDAESAAALAPMLPEIRSDERAHWLPCSEGGDSHAAVSLSRYTADFMLQAAQKARQASRCGQAQAMLSRHTFLQ